MEDISGFEVQNNLVSWTPLLEEWLLTTKRLYRLIPDDYTSSERAHVSILTGAAWRCGWVAINEIRRIKNRDERSFTGRGDLLLHSEEKRYFCEAKAAWDGPGLGKVSGQLKRACEEAKSAGLSNEIPCGIVFIFLSLPGHTDEHKLKQTIH